MTKITRLACTCSKVVLELSGDPMISAECHCDSCRAGSTTLQALAGSPTFMEPNGGTHYVLYRKDRVSFKQGSEYLEQFRLKGDSPSRRVLATCCNTPVFLEFEKAHWLSLYACMWPDRSAPAAEERTMISDMPDSSVLLDDIPNMKHQSLTFYRKLLGAWIMMGFKVPKVNVAQADHRF